MFNCNECIKKDVCGKMSTVEEVWEQLRLNMLYQKLINNNIKVDLTCNNFANSIDTETVYTKILGGSQDD